MHSLLRQRIDNQTLQPNAWISLEAARPAFAPSPKVAYHLADKKADTQRHHGEKHDLHPWRDITENLPRRLVNVERLSHSR
ncbi:MAG TPA: hypothetical protein VGG02_04245 [Chthoniobacterales bacterium]